MNTISASQTVLTHELAFADQGKGWRTIEVEQVQYPAGEGTCHFGDRHVLCLSLSPRPVRMLQFRENKTHTGLYRKGDISLNPADIPLFARWDQADHYVQIQIGAQFLQHVAQETFDHVPQRLEIIPEFQIRDPQIEAIGLLLLDELTRDKTGSQLYIDSLANVLAVHLLRQYTSTHPRRLSSHPGGLTQRQLLRVLDYIHEHLDQAIKLADLAHLLGISHFHFSRMFKQSTGVAPYQYLLLQRVERAKQLLTHTDQSIVDIAFQCGFNSHSHLSKQFRQLTGTTPTAFRATHRHSQFA
ncbi:MAG: AraC family transcriptional regulator [Kaiparowitsia implicata GSE-PSE-MK54-09C]|jgi:AraC family transcriptional regulator|nr:AraC family transcriptional regulator [Kaiparowitsia implicata GSE-PSE-MK54-09C]